MRSNIIVGEKSLAVKRGIRGAKMRCLLPASQSRGVGGGGEGGKPTMRPHLFQFENVKKKKQKPGGRNSS